MQKIFNYIVNGTGIGAKYIFIFSVVMAIAAAITIRTSGIALIPLAQNVSDQMLPIRVENGIVVEPYNTVKTAKIDLEGMKSPYLLPLVIDTTKDTLNTADLKNGLYLSRTTLYTVANNETRIRKLSGSFVLEKKDYTDFFKSSVNWIAAVSGFIGIAFWFIAYFLLSLFYSVCAMGVSALAAKKFDFDQRMRLSVLSLITVYVVFIPIEWAGFAPSKLLFFLAVIILQSLIVSRLPKLEEPKTETLKAE